MSLLSSKYYKQFKYNKGDLCYLYTNGSCTKVRVLEELSVASRVYTLHGEIQYRCYFLQKSKFIICNPAQSIPVNPTERLKRIFFLKLHAELAHELCVYEWLENRIPKKSKPKGVKCQN